MQDSNAHNDVLSNSKKILPKAQKLLLLASVRNDSLTLREYRNVLAECLQPEASANLKAIGFQLAHQSPTCSTSATWNIVMEALITELASSEDTSVLKHAIPLFDILPVIALIEFVMASEKEPMNKFRNVLLHADPHIHCLAIAVLTRLSIRIACSLADEILQSFPFESHEARIICQQDINLILIDIHKLIFQDLFASNNSVRSEAFTAMSNLFSQSALFQQSFPKETKSSSSYRAEALALNDLVCLVLREACPAICSLVRSADTLPDERKADGMYWLAMVLGFLMDRTGARCPGISVPYLTVDYDNDVEVSQMEGAEEELAQPSTQRLRMDQFAHDFLSVKLYSILRYASLLQASVICRASFHLLLHPLLEFSRFQMARPLLNHLITQCHHQETIKAKEEMAKMLFHTFLWLSASDCVQAFPQTLDALLLVDREREESYFVPLLIHGIVLRAICQSELVLLKLLYGLDLFQRFCSENTTKAISLSATCALDQLLQAHITIPAALRKRGLAEDSKALENIPASQILVLESFFRLLYPFPESKLFDIHHLQNGFMALLMDHFCHILSGTQSPFQESLQLMANLLDANAYPHISSQKARLQLVSLAIRMIPQFQTISAPLLLTYLEHEFGLLQTAFDANEPAIDFFNKPNRKNPFFDTEDHLEIVSSMVTCIKLLTMIQPSMRMQTTKISTQIASIMASKREEHMFLTQIESQVQPSVHATSPYLHDWFLHCGSSSIFNLAPLFACDPFSSDRALAWEQDSVVVSGSNDPLSIAVSYRHADPSQRNLITLIVSACNCTNFEMSDVELFIRYSANVSYESKCNDLVLTIRPHAYGAALLPNGTIRIERNFHVHQFSRPTFGFQLVFKEESTTDQESIAVVERIKLAACDPFIVGFDAFLRLKDEVAAPSASVFRVMWQSADDRFAFSVVSTALESTSSLSFAQTLINDCKACVHILPDLLIDSASHIHIAYIAQTQWKSRILGSLVLTARKNATKNSVIEWIGSLEVRSSKSVIFELQSAPEACLRIFVSNHVRLDQPQAHAAEPFETLVHENVLKSRPQPHKKVDEEMLEDMSTAVP